MLICTGYRLGMTHGEVDDIDSFDNRAAARRETEAESFQQGDCIERTVLNLIGAYENVVARANWLIFHVAGPEASRDKRDKLKVGLAKVAEGVDGWSQDGFDALFDQVEGVRQRLAHMLWIDSITGEWPDRTLRIVVPGRKGQRRARSELEWLDSGWSVKHTHIVEFEEQELVETLQRLWLLRGQLLQLRRAIGVRDMNLRG